jgi:SET domain-containing protein
VSSSSTPVPAEALDALFEARPVAGGRALFACRAIPKGTRLFGEDEWSDEEERRSFSTLSAQQLQELKPALRSTFLRYAYNTSPDAITGAFRPETVRHPVNFINHSCDPNAGYDGAGEIVTLRSIAAGEEISMDYGTYSFSFDHEFVCRCGASWCRRKVTGNDWRELVRAGLRLPGFMRAHVNRALWG